jgi:hypothetical protein
MSRFSLLFVVLQIISYISVSQSIVVDLVWVDGSRKLNENSKGQGLPQSSLFLENAFYPDAESMLPVFFGKYSLSNSISDPAQIDVVFSSFEYSSLLQNELDLISNKDKVSSQSDPSYSVFRDRGKSYLLVNVPAIRLNSSSGAYEKLIRFKVQVVEKEGAVLRGKSILASSNSVLAQGSWFKVAASKSGVYRITFSELQSMGLTNLQNISVWGHGGRQLPYWNNQASLDDLVQIPIWIETGSDGVFNQGDYILFYAEGPVTWTYNGSSRFFSHNIHGYSTKITYFLTTSVGNVLRIPTQSTESLAANYSSNSFDALMYFERNDTNLIKSGRQWFGESFDVYTSRNYNSGIVNPVIGDTARINFQTAARSGSPSSFTAKANGSSVGSIPHASVNLSSDYSNFVSISNRTFNYMLTPGELKLELTYNKPSPSAKAWLDFITINARQQLKADNNQLQFRDLRSVGQGRITQFTIESSISGLTVWDVTDIFNPQKINTTSTSGTYSFKTNTEQLKSFIAFSPNQLLNIELLGAVTNQNIHGQPIPGMVIVAHPSFLDHAQALADLHFETSGLNSLVVTTEQVYNEFSGGNVDVSAIRNMMRMFYQRATSEASMPKYLMLFGDGSYDNLTQSVTNTNLIATYQSVNSINSSTSFVTDDFFGLLDDNEGESTGMVDIGIGRIPASSKADADIVVNKIRSYLSPSTIGSWHSQLSFIADDQDNNVHMTQSDDLATFVSNNYPLYNIEKIYFDAYPQITTAQGHRYPGVTDAINNRANQGALIMNYTGHANARWLSHEKVLMVSDIQSWRNFERLPLFVTATCEYSRFDDFVFKSAGEHILFSPKGGGVGLVTTTRIVYSYPNFVLNRNFFQTVFERNMLDLNGPTAGYYRLGDVVRITKNMTGGDNKLNFMLLGDPALRLHYPSGEVLVSEINGTPVSAQLDTLKALSRVVIKGLVTGARTPKMVDGQTELTLFDKKRTITTLSNDGIAPFTFETRGNTIYKGRSSIVDGAFEAEFIVPKDILYTFGNGRFSLFASDGQITSAGFFEDFLVGGISENIGTDTQGPELKIYMNDTKFVSGGITDINPRLIIHLSDSSGINTTGTGIGHDLTATLVGASQKTYVLNEYYSSEIDDFRKGKVDFQLINLEKGNYTISVKAWDVFNNSTEAKIDFQVRSDDKLELNHILNYPNPFTERTAFYFEHNQPYEDLDVSIQVFSPSGKLVKSINQFVAASAAYRIGPIPWDGFDDFGDRIGRGVYFYKLRVKLSNGKYAEAYQKLVILK